jgi:hypothetical protein
MLASNSSIIEKDYNDNMAKQFLVYIIHFMHFFVDQNKKLGKMLISDIIHLNAKWN